MSPLRNVNSEQNHPIGIEQVYWAKVRAKLLAAILLMLILLFLRSHGWAQGGGLKPTGSETQNVICVSGCSSSSSPSYGSAFPATGTPIGFKLGANLSWATVDGSNNLNVNCTVGCSASAGFADNGVFTAGTTTLNIAAGWYSTSPTNCTSGSACAPQLTLDRKLFVQAFQGTSPWVVSQPTGSNLHVVVDTAPTTAVTQSTSPWVDSVISWGGGTLGAMANYGTSPGAVLVPGVNSFITNIPHIIVDTAPTTAVTGTFWQATQPVTGTFWQATQPVSIAGTQSTSDAADGSTGSAVPSKGIYAAANGSGNLTGIIGCDNSVAVSMSTATTTQMIAISGTGGRTYICSINLVAAGADNVTMISGSGSNCASNVAALIGGTTAATGWNFAANGGLTMGSGLGMLIKTTTTNNEVCLVTSAAVQLSGSITYTQF